MGYIAVMVTICIKKMIMTCLAVTRHLCDTIIVVLIEIKDILVLIS